MAEAFLESIGIAELLPQEYQRGYAAGYSAGQSSTQIHSITVQNSSNDPIVRSVKFSNSPKTASVIIFSMYQYNVYMNLHAWAVQRSLSGSGGSWTGGDGWVKVTVTNSNGSITLRAEKDASWDPRQYYGAVIVIG